MRKSICIIALTPIARDARVLRQIHYLSPLYDLTVIGYGPPHPSFADSPAINWVQLDRLLQPTVPNLRAALRNLDLENLNLPYHAAKRVNRYFNKALLSMSNASPRLHELWYKRQPFARSVLACAIRARCHAYHANDWNTLPMAAAAARKTHAALVLDLHEYAPLQYMEHMEGPTLEKQKRLITYTLQKYLPQVDAAVTVAAPLARRYCEEFGIQPTVIMNTPERVEIPPPSMDSSSVNIIHHGMVSKGRRPELMIETIARCDSRYNLHLMLLPHDYLSELKSLAEKRAPGRVFFHDTVPPEDIIREISRYDVGLCIFPPVNYSSFASLPNKFFDYICAGLAVCTGPSPSMTEIIRRYEVGLVCDTFEPEDMASMLNQTSMEQWLKMRKAARIASTDLNAEVEMGKLVHLYDSLLTVS